MKGDIDKYIEAILFHKAESVKIKELSKILEVSKEEIQPPPKFG